MRATEEQIATLPADRLMEVLVMYKDGQRKETRLYDHTINGVRYPALYAGEEMTSTAECRFMIDAREIGNVPAA